MASYLLAICFLLITPGPGVLTTAGVGAAFGVRSGLAYMWGIVAGSMMVMAAVATGLAAVVLSYPPLRAFLLAVSLTYLLYIAWRVATAHRQVAIVAAQRPLGFLNGLVFSVINPKAYAVMTTLFTGFALLPGRPALEGVLKMAVYFPLAAVIHLGWLYAGASLKRLALGEVASRRINLLMALAMLAVVGMAAWSSDLVPLAF